MPGSVITPDNSTLNLYFNPLFASGKWLLKRLQMIASVAMYAGAAVYHVGNGTHTIVTNATTNFAGILMEKIAAIDPDYATSLKMKVVAIPISNDAEAEFAVGAGTFTSADVGKSVLFNDAYGLAVDSAGIQARITRYLSSTRGACVFNQDIV